MGIPVGMIFVGFQNKGSIILFSFLFADSLNTFEPNLLGTEGSQKCIFHILQFSQNFYFILKFVFVRVAEDFYWRAAIIYFSRDVEIFARIVDDEKVGGLWTLYISTTYVLEERIIEPKGLFKGYSFIS